MSWEFLKHFQHQKFVAEIIFHKLDCLEEKIIYT